MSKSDRKPQFLEAFKKSMGIIQPALDAIHISRTAYRNWRRADPAFDAACKEIEEEQIDFVENQLLKKIAEGDTTALIFYLKTKGIYRGWNEKYVLAKAAQPAAEVVAAEFPASSVMQDKMKEAEERLRTMLSLSPDAQSYLNEQISSTARLIALADIVWEHINKKGMPVLVVETSREGSSRVKVNDEVELWRVLNREVQRALQALGLNADAKGHPVADDPVSAFMKGLGDDGQ